MKIFNILFVGGGRRVTLANLFKRRGFNIFSYETSLKVPISSVGTILLGKKWKDPEIKQDLINKIKECDIDLVIPLMDEAVSVCAELKNLFPFIVTPGLESANICLDKLLFEQFMLENYKGFYPVPDTTDIISKPRFGFASRGIIYGKSESPYMINQRIIKGQEYSVDCYFDKKGKYIDGMARQRDRVFDGEVISSSIVYDPILITIASKIGEHLQLVGPTVFQFILDENTYNPYLIEINSRFGGGTILSMQAGLNIEEYLIEEYIVNGTDLKQSQHKQFLTMERYLEPVYFEQHD